MTWHGSTPRSTPRSTPCPVTALASERRRRQQQRLQQQRQQLRRRSMALLLLLPLLPRQQPSDLPNNTQGERRTKGGMP